MISTEKGMFSIFTILTSIITGAFFPLLGSLIAFNLKVINSLYLEGIILTMFGGFIAHWVLAHTIHDLFHYEIEDRITISKNKLKTLFVLSILVLLAIALYLTYKRGWPVLILAIVGGILCLYAEGLLHHESQMAFGAMFLVIGGFYVQAATLEISVIVWLKVLSLSLFAFLSQYGWLLFYRLDDYNWSQKMKTRSILVTKSGLVFLIIYFLM